jgi:hypothetical protein
MQVQELAFASLPRLASNSHVAQAICDPGSPSHLVSIQSARPPYPCAEHTYSAGRNHFVFPPTTEHMINDPETAEKFYGTLLLTSKKLTQAFEEASEILSEYEKNRLGRAVGNILDTITSEGLKPLLEAHARLGKPNLFGMLSHQSTDELPDCLTQFPPGLAGHYELAPAQHAMLCAPYTGFEVNLEVIPAMERISLMATKSPHHGVSRVVIEGTIVRLEPMIAMDFVPHASFRVYLSTGSEVRVRNESNCPIEFYCLETRLLTSSD